MDNQLQIKNISVGYGGPQVIQNLTVTLSPGSFVGLLGPNGAGKTTLLLNISGQFKPDEGVVEYKQKDIYKNNLWFKRKIGYVHESPFFYPNLTVTEFMQFVAGIKKIPRETSDTEITTLLENILLFDQRTKLTSQISMGMRKKLAIASAFLGSPEIVFLDEALNGVDFESAFHIKEILTQFVGQGGMVILSSHVLETVEKLCSRNLILNDGKLIADLSAGKLEEINKKGQSLEGHLVEMLSGLK